jgi:hypothetical protein
MRLKELRELALAASDDGFDGPLEAIDYAEANASETDGIRDAEHFEQVAYDSIAWTGPFNDDRRVSAWFAANGYRW